MTSPGFPPLPSADAAALKHWAQAWWALARHWAERVLAWTQAQLARAGFAVSRQALLTAALIAAATVLMGLMLLMPLVFSLLGSGGGPRGMIYTEFAGEVHRYQVGKRRYGSKPLLRVGPSSTFDDFDVSWDNKKILLTLDAEGSFNFDERRYLLRRLPREPLTKADIGDGRNLFDHLYEWGGISYTSAQISPNQRYVVLESQHFSDLPVTLLDARSGETVNQWQIDGVKTLHHGKPVWTRDNSLYFRADNTLYRAVARDGYRSIRAMARIDGASHIAVNPQGTHIVYVKDRHLYMARIDGSRARQITESRTVDGLRVGGESLPVFSPDGRYIAFSSHGSKGGLHIERFVDGSEVHATGGKFGYLTIIPADGRRYNLDKKNRRVRYPTDKDGSRIPLSSRPVWR